MAAKLKDIIFDELKLNLSLGKGKASLSAGVRENCPFLQVRTKVDGDVNNGLIVAAMDPKTFYALMEMIRTIARNNGPLLYSVDNKSNMVNGKYNPDAQVVSRTTVQKKEDGCVYISINARSRPVIEFRFHSDEYHNFVDSQGAAMPDAVISKLSAVGYANMLEKLMSNVLADNYVEPEWRKKNNQQQGGGQYNNQQRPQQQQGRPQQSQGDSFDDDIPF